MASCWSITKIFILVFLGFFGIVFTGIGAFFVYTMYHSKANCIPSGRIKYAHRSNTLEYQENSLEAVLATVEINKGAEIDIYQISTGEMILFHDSNALRLTNVDLDIEKATLSQIQSLSYVKEVNGKTYSTTPKIAMFKDAIEQLCKKSSNHSVDFDIKFVPNESNSKQFFDIINNSPCECSSIQKFIFATPYFYATSYLRNQINQGRCKGKIAIWFYPDVMPLGEYFWIKTRASIYIGSPDVVTIYNKIIDQNPELLTDLNNDGYCTGVYGNYENKLESYNYTDYAVVDVSSASIDDKSYTSQESIYNWLVALFILAGISLCIFCVWMLYLLISKCCGKKDN